MLFQLVADLKTPQEVEEVFGDVFSQTELITLAKRLAVAYWLAKKRSYGNIKQNLKVSSASVADIQQRLKNSGWKLAITKVTADEWATVWDHRIKQLFAKRTGNHT